MCAIALVFIFALILPLQGNAAFAATQSVDIRLRDDLEYLRELERLLRAQLVAAPERYRLSAETPDVIVTIGRSSLRAALAEKRIAPILAIGIARPTWIAVLEERGLKAEYVRDASAVFVGQSPQHNLALARFLLPKAKTLGVFDSPSLPVRPTATAAATLFGFALVSEPVSSTAESLAALERLLKRCDVIVATQTIDSVNNTNIRPLVLAALLAGKPIVGGISDGFVLEGALAAIFSTQQHVVDDVLWRLDLQRTAQTLGSSGYAKKWDVRINRASAKTLQLNVPDDETVKAGSARLLSEQ